MDLVELKQILNSDSSDEVKKSQVINCLAKDKEVIPVIMRMLEREREIKSELITDMNHELSRAHVFIDDFMPEPVKLKKGETMIGFDKNFVLDKIAEFYINYKSLIRHCYNRFN